MNPLAKYWLKGLSCAEVCEKYRATPEQVREAIGEAVLMGVEIHDRDAFNDRLEREFPPVSRGTPRKKAASKKKTAARAD